MHTDNAYFTDPARLQLFHLLSHTDGAGGESLLVDGFRAARVLYTENPKHGEWLRTIPQPFHSSGNPDVSIQPSLSYRTVLNFNKRTGVLYQIRWNNYDRAPGSDVKPERQMEWFAAARHWDDIIRRPEMEIRTQLKPGTALSKRLLHLAI